jgi:hypothetical protein
VELHDALEERLGIVIEAPTERVIIAEKPIRYLIACLPLPSLLPHRFIVRCLARCLSRSSSEAAPRVYVT